MSDRTELLGLLRRLPGVLFVEPSRELYMQDELHTRAEELLVEHGLGPQHPYVGWYAQANSFTRSGSLDGGQRLYFGAGRETIGEALRSTLEPHGFLVRGGRSEHEAFEIRRDARPASVDAEQHGAWDLRLDALSSGDDVELREGEAELLHAGLASPGLADLQARIARVLAERDLLVPADLDHLFTTDAVDRLRMSKARGGAQSDLSLVLVAALRLDRDRALDVVRTVARAGHADDVLLAAWGGPEAVEAARDHALADPVGTSVYLDLVAGEGGDPIAAFVDLAQEFRDTYGNSRPDPRFLAALVRSFGTAGRETVGRGAALEVLRDDRIPGWIKVLVGDQYTLGYQSPEEISASAARNADGVARSRYPGRAADAPEVARAWPDAVDEVRRAEGLPPSPGFVLGRGADERRVLEDRVRIVERHLEGLRGALHDPELSEPDAGLLLELLFTAGKLRPEDLAPLFPGWKKRFFVKQENLSCVAPAVLTLAMAAREWDLPEARTIIQTIVSDTRKWVEPVAQVLRALLVEPGTNEDWITAFPAAWTGGTGAETARFALVKAFAADKGSTPLVIALACAKETLGEAGYVSRGFVTHAISHAALMEDGMTEDAQSRVLWPEYFDPRSVRMLEAALELVEIDAIPEEVRRRILEVSTERTFLGSPERAHIEPHPDTVEELRSRLEAAKESLSN